jgi:hypothetical protein
MSTLLDAVDTTEAAPPEADGKGAGNPAEPAGEAGQGEAQQAEGEAASAVPDAYTVDLPEDLQTALAGGGVLADDPVFQGFVEHAKSIGMSQEQFGGVMTWAADLVKAHSTTTTESQTASQQAELKALQAAFGAQLPTVAKSVKAYTNAIAAQVPGAAIALDGLATTAAGVQLLHAMASGALKPATSGNLPGGAAMAPPPALTEADLKAMVADPRYWREKDPAFVKKVSDGFQRLYPG